jgi:hypothetical protein
MKSLLLLTTQLSVVVQIITGIFGLQGIFYKLPQPHSVLVDLLRIEMVVQTVELGFYLTILNSFNASTMAITRYYDWVFTTPTMLFTMMAYFRYRDIHESHSNNTPITISSFFKDNRTWIIGVFLCNFMMLVFGYAGELGWINKLSATLFGFVFFGISFYIIYSQFAIKNIQGTQLFYVLFVIWSLYGIAYLLPSDWKNISYNGLDIIAKNFFGIYLYFKIRELQSKTKTLKK